jgi:hypothetical protein
MDVGVKLVTGKITLVPIQIIFEPLPFPYPKSVCFYVLHTCVGVLLLTTFLRVNFVYTLEVLLPGRVHFIRKIIGTSFNSC